MSAVVIDTHTLIWAATNDASLSAVARAALTQAEQTGQPVYVPTISIVELRYLVEKRTLTEAEFTTLIRSLRNPASSLAVVPLDLDIAEQLQQVPRDIVPDMPDRIIAATALAFGLPLVTRDRKIRALPNVTTIW